MLNRAIFLSLMGALAALNLPAQVARATIGGRSAISKARIVECRY